MPAGSGTTFLRHKDFIEEGDTVIIYLNHNALTSVVVKRGLTLNMKYGALRHEFLIGKPYDLLRPPCTYNYLQIRHSDHCYCRLRVRIATNASAVDTCSVTPDADPLHARHSDHSAAVGREARCGDLRERDRQWVAESCDSDRCRTVGTSVHARHRGAASAEGRERA